MLWSMEVAEPHTVGLKPPTSGVGAVTGMEGATLNPASGRRCSAGGERGRVRLLPCTVDCPVEHLERNLDYWLAGGLQGN